MGIFHKRTNAEKARDAAIKKVKKDAREDRKDARKDSRAEKKTARKDARAEKQDARQTGREEKKAARQDKRDAMKKIRKSDVTGRDKRDAKKGVRDTKHDAMDAAKDGKRSSIDAARQIKKSAKHTAHDEKRTRIRDNRTQELADLTAAGTGAMGLNVALGLDLLGLSTVAQFGTMSSVVGSLRGSSVKGLVNINRKNLLSDTESFVARSDAGDVVVAFRGSETRFFNKSGAFRDWVLTDLRSHRMPYPPAPSTWPDQRWVHAGIWQAYEIVRNPLLAEVGRQVSLEPAARRVFVTGFSLGGALALLAALDIADALPKTPVELFTFAAPRAGDATLNKLLSQRVQKSTLVSLRGDPVVHLPPLGPNFPITFKTAVSVDLGKIHVGLGNPAVPSLFQEYRTADTLFYITKDGNVQDHYPLAKVALNFNDHNFSHYQAALEGLQTPMSKTMTTG